MTSCHWEFVISNVEFAIYKLQVVIRNSLLPICNLEVAIWYWPFEIDNFQLLICNLQFEISNSKFPIWNLQILNFPLVIFYWQCDIDNLELSFVYWQFFRSWQMGQMYFVGYVDHWFQYPSGSVMVKLGPWKSIWIMWGPSGSIRSRCLLPPKVILVGI